MQGKDIVPVPGKLARCGVHQCMAIAHKVRLIEISSLVNNFGPGPRRVLAMRHQRRVKPDGSCIELGGKPYLCGETALKMARAQTGSLGEGIDSDLAARSQQKP